MKEEGNIKSLLFRKKMAEKAIARGDLSPSCVKLWEDKLKQCNIQLKALGYEKC